MLLLIANHYIDLITILNCVFHEQTILIIVECDVTCTIRPFSKIEAPNLYNIRMFSVGGRIKLLFLFLKEYDTLFCID